MFKYPIVNANLEVIKYEIKDNKSFDAEIQVISLNHGELGISFDRALTSLEDEEVSGYVSGHVVEDFYTYSDYKVEEYSNSGRIQKITYYYEKIGEAYSGKVREEVYTYANGNHLSHYIEEKYDMGGNVYARVKYSVFSDPVTNQVMVEEEYV